MLSETFINHSMYIYIMVDRKAGERAKILFDNIDLKIIKMLNGADYGKGFGVLELADKLGLNHKNLKPHLDKLLHLGLIFIFKDENGEAKLYTYIRNMETLTGQEFDSETDYHTAVRKVNDHKVLVEYLEKVDSLEHNKEMKEILEMDLRKMKRNTKTTNLQIGGLSKTENLKILEMATNDKYVVEWKDKGPPKITLKSKYRHKK